MVLIACRSGMGKAKSKVVPDLEREPGTEGCDEGPAGGGSDGSAPGQALGKPTKGGEKGLGLGTATSRSWSSAAYAGGHPANRNKGEDKVKRYLLLALALALVLTAVALPALAQEEVTTSAVITGEGSPPRVKAKWELSPNDDPAVPGIQIIPNPAPNETAICVYAVVEDPNGIEDITAVYADVYHPDGSLKVQVHMVMVSDAEAMAAIEAAMVTGQIDAVQAAELLWELEKRLATMWKGCFSYEVHQPAGVYTVAVWAVDQQGAQSEHLVNTFDVLSIVVLAIDFDSVDYGPILPSKVKWVGGDDVFQPGDGRPTVWNLGNDPAMLRLHSTQMVGVDKGKIIGDFDVQLFDQHELYVASQWVDLAGPLEPCTPTQIDFSIHAPDGTPADTYTGLMHLAIAHAPAP